MRRVPSSEESRRMQDLAGDTITRLKGSMKRMVLRQVDKQNSTSMHGRALDSIHGSRDGVDDESGPAAGGPKDAKMGERAPICD